MSYESGYVTFTVQDVNGDQHTIGTGGHLGDHFVNDGEQPITVEVL